MIDANLDQCTGCGACVQRCPVQCISWVEGEFGFCYPQVDRTCCCECGLCVQVCPITKPAPDIQNQGAFAAVHRDSKVLEASTSGGAFSSLAEYVLLRGGTVYGCYMDQAFQTKHVRINDRADLSMLRGSKYVQSEIDTTYIQAKKDLIDGKYVLFTGTPCQIAGLNHFLGRDYSKLITADIVCHGVGSQKYFDKFISFLNLKYGGISELRFRSKKYAGWSCGGMLSAENKGRKIQKPFNDFNQYYYYYFLHGDIYREACYSCRYANTMRCGDFTLGDFWGVESLKLPLNTERGCSLVLVNTPKGWDISRELGDLKMVSVSIEEAVSQNGQLKHPSARSKIRDMLKKQYEQMDGAMIDRDFRKRHRFSLVKLHMKALVPYHIELLVRKMRK